MRVSSVGGGGRRVRGRVNSQLLLYNFPPTEEIDLEEFEEFAFDRLKVLRSIEQFKARGVKQAEMKGMLKKVADNNLPFRHSTDPVKDAECKRKDHVSHFILRLAYCQNEEKRKWFLQNESQLFRHRISYEMTAKERKQFLMSSEMHFDIVSTEEKMKHQRGLLNTYQSLPQSIKKQVFGIDPEADGFIASADQIMGMEFYKVSFLEATELVKRRHCYVKAGMCYIPINLLISTIVISSDRRLNPVLKELAKNDGGGDFNSTTKIGAVTPGEIDKLALRSFPMCMKNLQSGLKRDHKLRHEGRMQYGLFLKGIGLSLEDALVFWQTEFTKAMTVEQFNKQYAYNIRHNYGKEGKRADYTPYSCQKIIMGAPPGAGEHHGCPFRHFSESHVRSQMQHLRVKKTDVDDIIDQVKSGNYQMACRRHFEVTHPEGDEHGVSGQHVEFVGNHPNEWFDASVRYYTEKEASKGGSAPAGQDKQASSPSSASKSPAVANPGPAAAPGFAAPPAAAAAGPTPMED